MKKKAVNSICFGLCKELPLMVFLWSVPIAIMYPLIEKFTLNNTVTLTETIKVVFQSYSHLLVLIVSFCIVEKIFSATKTKPD